MKKRELYITGAVIIIALVWFIVVKITAKDGKVFNVYRDNELILSGSLSVDNEYYISEDGIDIMKIVIKDGYADVVYADCPDKLCVNMNSICDDSGIIVCLPNRIVVEVAKE